MQQAGKVTGLAWSPQRDLKGRLREVLIFSSSFSKVGTLIGKGSLTAHAPLPGHCPHRGASAWPTRQSHHALAFICSRSRKHCYHNNHLHAALRLLWTASNRPSTQNQWERFKLEVSQLLMVTFLTLPGTPRLWRFHPLYEMNTFTFQDDPFGSLRK